MTRKAVCAQGSNTVETSKVELALFLLSNWVSFVLIQWHQHHPKWKQHELLMTLHMLAGFQERFVNNKDFNRTLQRDSERWPEPRDVEDLWGSTSRHTMAKWIIQEYCFGYPLQHLKIPFSTMVGSIGIQYHIKDYAVPIYLILSNNIVKYVFHVDYSISLNQNVYNHLDN